MNVSINEARDLAVLQKRAEEIGLGFADESQVRYINVEVPVEEMPETEEEGIDVLDVLESVRSVFG